ncbi:uncharacterized protein B0H18DRAFT_1081520 [Fomitopsis serialis]|uniref:uncharacterized protein n=1 Tax=Fomitopsis serialis TaxID=139415 RepID=UPI0020085989|nr:uncharacterized protein B0H18DRAFT_1081520 [Neoantrodia serialis]KAH9937280.1 hypothetical protein B0H18DRAFT_1081520 [Neoantrodia serialis]
MASNDRDGTEPWKIASVVSFYMGAALVAVLNSSPELPMLFLFIQLALAVVLLHSAAFLSPKVEIPKLDGTSAKKLTPLILVNVIGLVFNTLCLRGVEASFFQIARGLVLPLTIAVSSMHTHTTPSMRVILAATIVTIGFFLGVAPSSFPSFNVDASEPSRPSTSGLSIFYGVLSSVFIAVHSVLIKISLPHANNSTIQLAYWQNLGSALFLAPVILLQGELGKLSELSSLPTWNGSVSVKVTSPITHMFSSAARSVIQTLLGVWLFNDLLTTNRAASILVITLGTVCYTWVKAIETAPRPHGATRTSRRTQPDEGQRRRPRRSRDGDADAAREEVARG